MPTIGSILRPYSECRQEILDGDVLIWHGRPRKFLHVGIQDAAAARFIHAAMAGWCYGRTGDLDGDGRLLLAEFHKSGGSMSLLSSQLRGESERWSVFRPHFYDEVQRRQAFDNMVQMTGLPYNNRAIVANLLRSLPVLRWFFGGTKDEIDATTWGAETCSGSVTRSLRLVGYDPISGDSWSDPVPHKADYLCSPTDLVRSSFLEYQFTLIV